MSRAKPAGDPVQICDGKGVLIDVTRESLHQATGTTDKMLGSHLLIQAVKASGHGALSRSEQFEKLGAIVSQLAAVAPTDSLEGMLAVQLVSIHNMAMALLANATARTVKRGSAASQASQNLADLRMGRAMKLIAQFQRGLEALDRRRGKGGQQRIVVERIDQAAILVQGNHREKK